MNRFLLSTIVALSSTTCVHGFTTSFLQNNRYRQQQSISVLYEGEIDERIEGLPIDAEEVDEGLGGVRLAEESAIKIVGDIKHKPGKSETYPNDLLRYNTLKEVDEAVVKSTLQKYESTVLCYGQGVEVYKDPGQTTINEVYYAPSEAVKDALTNAKSAMSSTSLVFNFLGGDDLMCGEVLQAANELVLDLDIPTSTKIKFNSLCHKSIPSGTCAITVVSLGNEPNDTSFVSGVEKAVASGEIYLRDGIWYTVEESDINTALA
jgi:hypothetical protein